MPEDLGSDFRLMEKYERNGDYDNHFEGPLRFSVESYKKENENKTVKEIKQQIEKANENKVRLSPKRDFQKDLFDAVMFHDDFSERRAALICESAMENDFDDKIHMIRKAKYLSNFAIKLTAKENLDSFGEDDITKN